MRDHRRQTSVFGRKQRRYAYERIMSDREGGMSWKLLFHLNQDLLEKHFWV
jgi:hypothetical protein